MKSKKEKEYRLGYNPLIRIPPKGLQKISDIILSPFRGSGVLYRLCRGLHPCLWYAVPFGTFEASFYLKFGVVWASDITGVVTDESVGNDGVKCDNANIVTDDTDGNMVVK